MAYMSQEKKKEIAPKVKEICKRHGIKATLSVLHGMTLCLNIKSGEIDFFADSDLDPEKERGQIQVNVYHYKDHFTGKSKAFLSEVIPALNNGNHDNSDAMTDYFDVGWYVDVNVGRFQKPYIFTGKVDVLNKNNENTEKSDFECKVEKLNLDDTTIISCLKYHQIDVIYTGNKPNLKNVPKSKEQEFYKDLLSVKADYSSNKTNYSSTDVFRFCKMATYKEPVYKEPSPVEEQNKVLKLKGLMMPSTFFMQGMDNEQ